MAEFRKAVQEWQLNLVVGVDDWFDGITQREPHLCEPYGMEMCSNKGFVGDVQARGADVPATMSARRLKKYWSWLLMAPQ